MTFIFENTGKDIIMTDEVEKDFEIENLCRFCDKEKNSNKSRFSVFQQARREIQLIKIVVLTLHGNMASGQIYSNCLSQP